MADRTSAEIFGGIFEYLAKQPESEERTKFALKMWKMCRCYDFSHYQMDADDYLIALKLAKVGVDPEYPDDGEVTIYADGDGKLA